MMPCGKSELLIFDETPIQVAATSGAWVDYHSISNPTTTRNPIEFVIPATQDEYIDLNDTKLYLQLSVKTTPATTSCAPVNCLLSSLYQDVMLSLNDVMVQGGSQLYAYKSMIENMLLFDNSTKITQLRAGGFFPDQAGHVNEAANTGYVERATWIATNKVIELIGPLHLDMMTQPKYLIPQVNIKVRLVPHSSDQFALLSYDTAAPITAVTIKVHKAILYVRRVKVLPSVVDGHELGLQHNNAAYPIQHVDMQTVTIARGFQSFSEEHLFQGKMPKLVVVCMVSNTAFNGALNQNPFNFQHFGLTYCGLFRDGESIPERTPYIMDSAGQLTRPYMGMIHALEQFNRNENNGITLHEYEQGSLFFVFNLTPDLVVGSGCQQAFRTGNLRLEMKFGTALTETINVIVYGVFDGKIEITKDRIIKLDYL